MNRGQEHRTSTFILTQRGSSTLILYVYRGEKTDAKNENEKEHEGLVKNDSRARYCSPRTMQQLIYYPPDYSASG
jgi:hypothetical protein